jgi:hypothetical protein
MVLRAIRPSAVSSAASRPAGAGAAMRRPPEARNFDWWGWLVRDGPICPGYPHGDRTAVHERQRWDVQQLQRTGGLESPFCQ